jgi:hypothetical protein
VIKKFGGAVASEFVGAVARAAFEFTGGIADFCVAAARPEVVRRTVQSAKRINSRIGQRDRHALLAHMGLLPTAPPVTVRLRESDQTAPEIEPDGSAFPKATKV